MIPPRDIDDMDIAEQHQEDDTRWHLDKQIPISLLAVLILQTGGGVWWAATMSGKIDNATAVLTRWENERYTKADGDRDRQLMQFYVGGLERRDVEFDRRLHDVEQNIQQHFRQQQQDLRR